MRIWAIYLYSIIQGFESFLRTEIDLVGDDINLALDDNISGLTTTYEIEPGMCTSKDISEALFNILQTEYDFLTTMLILNLMILPCKLN